MLLRPATRCSRHGCRTSVPPLAFKRSCAPIGDHRTPLRRPCSSGPTKPSEAVIELPPRLLRVALVGMSTAVLTPVYATVGVMRLSRVIFTSRPGGFIAVIFIGGVLTVIGVSCMDDIYAFIANNSNLLLPFAISNGATAAAIYALVEKPLIANSTGGASGISSIISSIIGKGLSATDLIKSNRLLIIPAAIGGATALLSPLLWAPTIRLCWSQDERDFYLNNDLAWPSKMYRQYILFPLGIPTGVFTGLSLGLVLDSVVVRPCDWRITTLPAFLAVSAAGAVYFGLCRDGNLGFWETRTDARTGSRKSFNPKTGEVRRDGGLLGERVRNYKALSAVVQQGLLGFVIPKVLFFILGSHAKGGEKQKKREYVRMDLDDKQHMSIAAMAERDKVLPALDLMLQHKHLVLSSSARGAEASLGERNRRNELSVAAYRDARIEDLEFLVCTFENLIIARKRGDAAAEKRFYDQIMSAIGSDSDIVILADNAALVERDLARELGYILTATTPYRRTSSLWPTMNRRRMTQVVRAATTAICVVGTLVVGSWFF